MSTNARYSVLVGTDGRFHIWDNQEGCAAPMGSFRTAKLAKQHAFTLPGALDVRDDADRQADAAIDAAHAAVEM